MKIDRRARLTLAYTLSIALNGAFWLAYSHELRFRNRHATPPAPSASAADAVEKLQPMSLGVFHPLPPATPPPPEKWHRAKAARQQRRAKPRRRPTPTRTRQDRRRARAPRIPPVPLTSATASATVLPLLRRR